MNWNELIQKHQDILYDIKSFNFRVKETNLIFFYDGTIAVDTDTYSYNILSSGEFTIEQMDEMLILLANVVK